MYPWLWFVAPQFHFPFSGSVAQRIDPDTSWFFSGIRPEAGDGALEKDIFEVASYGHQIGLISDVLLAQTGSDAVSAEQGAQSLARLEAVQRKIEAVKARRRDSLTGAAAAALEQLQASDPAALVRLLARFAQPALPSPLALAKPARAGVVRASPARTGPAGKRPARTKPAA